MACYHPSKVDILRKALSESARRSEAVTVPCGSCLGCRMDQAGDWSVRLLHESEFPEVQPSGDPRGSWFVTLTYDDSYLPTNGTLDPGHARAFLARLRKRFPSKTVSYYLIGEYGEASDRPHYHAVLYGPQLLARELYTRRHDAPVWISEAIEGSWGMGISEFTALTPGNARYIAGYVRKKVQRKQAWLDAHYQRVDPATGEIVSLVPEFSRMSRRPAIGRRWIERYWKDVYPRDYVVVDGVERKPPRYYDKFMEVHHPQIMHEVREQRWKDIVEIGDDKLIMKEKIHRARVGLFESRKAV